MSVADAFVAYDAAVLAGASEADRTAARKAFYGGAYFTLMHAFWSVTADDAVSIEDGVAHLDAMKNELEAFFMMSAAPQSSESAHSVPDPSGEMRPLLAMLARYLKGEIPVDHGFCLLLFEYGARGNLYYVANGERSEVMTAMRGLLARFTQ